ncbi:MAG: hypothetical protein CGW95_08785 [Phenylobacterium zucineum]|nr:MAG: hypothetical protein CGW95_08785 [Phenylobacterium zucineum]
MGTLLSQGYFRADMLGGTICWPWLIEASTSWGLDEGGKRLWSPPSGTSRRSLFCAIISDHLEMHQGFGVLFAVLAE